MSDWVKEAVETAILSLEALHFMCGAGVPCFLQTFLCWLLSIVTDESVARGNESPDQGHLSTPKTAIPSTA
eukprot:scaffold2358_cov19-Tisochrysis_lutea.AAC.5